MIKGSQTFSLFTFKISKVKWSVLMSYVGSQAQVVTSRPPFYSNVTVVPLTSYWVMLSCIFCTF
jgi:hypothetical protein